MAVQFGADPEFCVVDEKTGRPVGAWLLDILPSKAEKKVHRLLQGTGVHRDGFGLEANPTHSHCMGTFLNRFVPDMRTLYASYLQPKGLTLRAVSSVEIPVAELLQDPRTPPGALDRGCDPSLNAFTGGPSQAMAVPPEVHPYREFAGHFHISSHNGRELQRFSLEDGVTRPLVKMWDQFVGLIDAVIFPGEASNRRRLFYGLAGDFRVQPHGLEYRVPSCEAWGHPAMVALYGFSLRALTWAVVTFGRRETDLVPEWSQEYEERLQLAINTGEGAREMVRDLPGVYLRENILELADRKDELQLTDLARNYGFGQRYSYGQEWHVNWPDFAGVTNVSYRGYNPPMPIWNLKSAGALQERRSNPIWRIW